jgi:DNA-cytosine methyltransferase
MNVLSLFNGMSFCSMALESLGVNVNKMYSSEIDKYANQATQAMFPDTIQLGDVTQWREWDIDWASIDLVTGGFPCQAWSMAGKQLGDKDERGMLFWTMLDIMKHIKYHNPKANFLIENVKMKKEFEQYITTHTENALGKVYKILINSALVSAQNRNRYYWTSFEVEQPREAMIYLDDVIELNVDDKFFVSQRQLDRLDLSRVKDGGVRVCFQSPGQNISKSECLQARDYKGISGRQYFTVAMVEGRLRKLTPTEYMRLQTVPEHHVDTLLNAGISNTQLYKMTGNGWTMEVIKHIFKALAINWRI